MRNRFVAAAAAILALGLAGGAHADDIDRAFSDTAAHTLSVTQAPRWAEVQARANLAPTFASAKTTKACKPASLEKTGKARLAKAQPAKTTKAATKTQAACKATELAAAVNAVRKASTTDQVMAVDRAVNTLPYVSDTQNWGVADYWETPQEMLARGGDCEGFALTKYFALRHLGVSDDAMRIAIVWDRRDREEHAVLLVRVEGDTWILDNKTAQPVRLADDSQRYSLIYSLNESGVRLPQAVRTAERAAPRARIVNGGRTLVLNVRRSGGRATA